jgi:hypothetical protein
MGDLIEKPEMKLGEALRFIVRLGQEDVSRLSRGALLDLIDGLRKYLNVGNRGKVDSELRQAEKVPEKLAGAIAVARQIIETVADHKKSKLRYEAGEYVIDASSGHRPLALESSSLRDAVLHFATGDIDDEAESLRIRRCPRCSRIFYGQTNAKFCSRRCASAEAVARYRAGATKVRSKSTAETGQPTHAVSEKDKKN